MCNLWYTRPYLKNGESLWRASVKLDSIILSIDCSNNSEDYFGVIEATVDMFRARQKFN